MSLRAEIIESAARTIFVQHWADQCICGSDAEDCRNGGESNPDFDPKAKHRENGDGHPPGTNLMDVAPETSTHARKAAKDLIQTIEKMNREKIHVLYKQAEKMKGHRKAPTPDDFGYSIAMSALGHGVSWKDDHPEAGIKIPDLGYCGPVDLPSWSVDKRFTSVRA